MESVRVWVSYLSIPALQNPGVREHPIPRGLGVEGG